jgi:hypothetical protein
MGLSRHHGRVTNDHNACPSTLTVWCRGGRGGDNPVPGKEQTMSSTETLGSIIATTVAAARGGDQEVVSPLARVLGAVTPHT